MQKHLYTVIIKIFTVSNDNFDLLINFQKFFLITSILFLFFILSKSNQFLALIFLLLITLNISYISYSKTILTESIFFSFFKLFFRVIFAL